ncbi:MAG: response regulator [Desulfocapsa sp.]|nr:response regulator [Desulfocapsa sp.]
MTTILIVDDDLGLQKILEFSLQKEKDEFQVLFASNGEEAVKILAQHQISLLVTDIKMPKMDGLALLAHMSVNYSATPCIVLTSYNIPGFEQKLSRLIFHFLKKPVDPVKLVKLIKKGLEQAKGGEALSGISVPGLMQIIEAEEKTCFLVIHSGGVKQGGMYFNEGVLYDSICGKLNGERAALQLISLETAQVEYRKLPQKNIPQRIKSGMQALILEAMRLKDEEEASEVENKEDEFVKREALLTEGIELCEGMHLKRAQSILLQVASKDSDNMLAWLWLSRTVGNMKQLRVALTKAYKLAPKHKDVKHDIKMFSLAGKAGLSKVRHCPYCFAPIAEKATYCPGCDGVLAISEDTLESMSHKGNPEEFRAALERFENVLIREINLPVLFYAALACLHLKDSSAALEYLEQLQQCVGPQESMYTITVERIVAFIASKQVAEEIHEDLSEAGQIAKEFNGSEVQKKKVLVVEDSPTTRKVIKMTLERNNFMVVEAGDGVEALIKINDEQPDIILLDVMLPKLDGYGILSVLKKNPKMKGVPVIMLTSKDGLKDKLKGRFSSASAYLTKPFKPEVLIEKVNQFI